MAGVVSWRELSETSTNLRFLFRLKKYTQHLKTGWQYSNEKSTVHRNCWLFMIWSMLFCLQSPHSHVEYIDLALVLGKECGGKACVAKPEGARSYKEGCIAPCWSSHRCKYKYKRMFGIHLINAKHHWLSLRVYFHNISFQPNINAEYAGPSVFAAQTKWNKKCCALQISNCAPR